MSVVVAIKEGNKVFVGADSQTTKGGTRRTLANPNNFKFWKVGNTDHCLMAHVGWVRDANLIKLLDLVSEYDVYKNNVDYRFVVKVVVPAIVETLSNAKYIELDKLHDGIDSSFLFIYKDQLYSIGSDLSVLEIDDYVAIGSGANQAVGSLLSTEGEDPKSRIIKALKASAASDIYVDYPIVIIDSESMQHEIITETDCKEN